MEFTDLKAHWKAKHKSEVTRHGGAADDSLSQNSFDLETIQNEQLQGRKSNTVLYFKKIVWGSKSKYIYPSIGGDHMWSLEIVHWFISSCSIYGLSFVQA